MNELTKSLEDYLEAAYIFELKNGFSRIKDISEFLNVSLPSVNKAMGELKKKSLITHEKYGYIKLTEKGKDYAKNVFKLHSNFLELLKLFGIDEKKANRYACYIEHIIEKDDINIINDIVEYFRLNQKETDKIKRFLEWRKNGKKSSKCTNRKA